MMISVKSSFMKKSGSLQRKNYCRLSKNRYDGKLQRKNSVLVGNAEPCLENIRLSLERNGLILEDKIGEGASASIYRARSTGLSGFGKSSWQGERGKIHAVKVLKNIDVHTLQIRQKEEFTKETEIHSQLNHINITSFHYKEDTFMVTEFCEGGSLFDALSCKNIKAHKILNPEHEKKLCEEVDRNMPMLNFPHLALDIIKALGYIHYMGFAHRDLKSSNILLSWNEELQRTVAKVCDFGSASHLSDLPCREKRSRIQTILGVKKGSFRPIGSLLWMPPEMLDPPIESSQNYCRADKVDVYACGVVFWEMMEWRLPWCEETLPSRQRVIKAVVKNSEIHLPFPAKISPSFKKLMIAMLQKDPRNRPDSSQVLVDLINIGGNWDTSNAFTEVANFLGASGKAKYIVSQALTNGTFLQRVKKDHSTMSISDIEGEQLKGGKLYAGQDLVNALVQIRLKGSDEETQNI